MLGYASVDDNQQIIEADALEEVISGLTCNIINNYLHALLAL